MHRKNTIVYLCAPVNKQMQKTTKSVSLSVARIANFINKK